MPARRPAVRNTSSRRAAPLARGSFMPPVASSRDIKHEPPDERPTPTTPFEV